MPIKIDPPTVTPTQVLFTVRNLVAGDIYYYTVNDQAGRQLPEGGTLPRVEGMDTGEVDILTTTLDDQPAGAYEFRVYEADEFDEATTQPLAGARPVVFTFQYVPSPPETEPPPPAQVVRLDRGASTPTTDEVLSVLVLTATSARSFAVYKAYVDQRVCRPRTGSAFSADTYQRLRRETGEFLEQVRPVIDPGSVLDAYLSADKLLPYVDNIAQRFPDALRGDPCSDLNPDLLAEPFPIELIWSYWQEEGGLVQTLNHILARFENRRVVRGRDPLARFDLSPLRPLRQILWSWAGDEISRLTVRHRAAEYKFEYGLPLVGRAVPDPSHLVESRSQASTSPSSRSGSATSPSGPPTSTKILGNCIRRERNRRWPDQWGSGVARVVCGRRVADLGI
ncbi:MAG: hypothetical protein ACRDOY_01485 [Nocardioidaceae bacterium]